MKRRDALLVLEDGSVWPGKAIGRIGETYGEIVSVGPDTALHIHRALVDLFDAD